MQLLYMQSTRYKAKADGQTKDKCWFFFAVVVFGRGAPAKFAPQ